MSISVGRLRPFIAPEGCSAAEALTDRGTLIKSDYRNAVNFLELTIRSGGGDYVLTDEDLSVLEGRYDFPKDLVALAGVCAMCKAQGGDKCNVAEQQEIEG